jgi:phosphonate utilization associated putative membrane protein
MTLTWPVVAAVLFGALLHAAWNARIKSSSDQAMDTAVMQLIGSVAMLPLAWLAGLPPPAAWPYIGASVLIHVGYFFTLAGAYRHGDLALTYPLMRGSAPLLVALSAGLLFGEPLSPLAWAGILGVTGGVLVLGLSPHALAAPRAVAFALANAVLIALYTLVDGRGVRLAGDALSYVLTLFVLNGWTNGLIACRRRGVAAVGAYARRHWPLALAGSAASLGSYGIALWAMTRAPVAAVAALRETSVLFAVLLGSWLLHERFTPRRAIGAAVIVAGVMALRLG